MREKLTGEMPPVDVDRVNNPHHYNCHPSGIECIQVTEHLNFCLGNAMKYIWRCDLKGDPIENLKKAVWYLEREIARRGWADPVGPAIGEAMSQPNPDLRFKMRPS